MPVAARDKLRALTVDLGSQAEVARVLGVSRSSITRWLQGEEPDPANRHKLAGLEFVVGRLLDVFPPGTAAKWLTGLNAHLGDRRPIDMVTDGRLSEVMAALEAEHTGGYA